MITTIFLLQLITFEVWYITSKQYKVSPVSPLAAKVIANGKQIRLATIAVALITLSLCIAKLSWASGIFGFIVGLMAAGSLVVAIQPFRYVKTATVVAIYVILLALEFLI